MTALTQYWPELQGKVLLHDGFYIGGCQQGIGFFQQGCRFFRNPGSHGHRLHPPGRFSARAGPDFLCGPGQSIEIGSRTPFDTAGQMSAAQPGSQCHASLGESIGTGQTVDGGQLKDHIGTALDSPGGTVPFIE